MDSIVYNLSHGCSAISITDLFNKNYLHSMSHVEIPNCTYVLLCAVNRCIFVAYLAGDCNEIKSHTRFDFNVSTEQSAEVEICAGR